MERDGVRENAAGFNHEDEVNEKPLIRAAFFI